jgi:small nuclear ribonucleoprotein (snRNP)-like protein
MYDNTNNLFLTNAKVLKPKEFEEKKAKEAR